MTLSDEESDELEGRRSRRDALDRRSQADARWNELIAAVVECRTFFRRIRPTGSSALTGDRYSDEEKPLAYKERYCQCKLGRDPHWPEVNADLSARWVAGPWVRLITSMEQLGIVDKFRALKPAGAVHREIHALLVRLLPARATGTSVRAVARDVAAKRAAYGDARYDCFWEYFDWLRAGLESVKANARRGKHREVQLPAPLRRIHDAIVAQHLTLLGDPVHIRTQLKILAELHKRRAFEDSARQTTEAIGETFGRDDIRDEVRYLRDSGLVRTLPGGKGGIVLTSLGKAVCDSAKTRS